MEYRQLGSTGLRVSPICFGAMMLGQWGNPDHDDCVRMLQTAIDRGINFIDTANVYSAGESETIVGKAIAGRREDVVVATKVWGPMGKGPNDRGLSRKHILRQVDESLRRLGTDYIDLYQIHRPDPATPVEETLRTLDDLVRQGKVRYLGCSTNERDTGSGFIWEATMPAWQMIDYLWIADKHGWEPFRSVQPPHSLMQRGLEADLIPAAARHGMGVIPWAPLRSGWLTGKYRKGQPVPADSRGGRNKSPSLDPDNPANARKVEVVDALSPLAAELGISLSQLAVAWSMAQPGITAPIIGPRTMEQLDDNLGALDVTLPPDVVARIDELVPSGTSI